MVSSANGYTGIVAILLSHGAGVDEVDEVGRGSRLLNRYLYSEV